MCANLARVAVQGEGSKPTEKRKRHVVCQLTMGFDCIKFGV
jgi:hypothetical protein